MLRPDQTSDEGSNRRRFLKAMGALGMTGLAGCGGDDDTDTPTGGNGNGTTESPTGTDPSTTAAPGTQTETDPGTDPGTPTETDPGTPTDGGGLPENRPPMISLGDEIINPSTETLTTTISNEFLFTIEDYSVEVDGPEGWELSTADETSFDALESGESHEVVWDLTLPEDASGEYELAVTASYARGEDQADVSDTLPITVDVWQSNDFTEISHFEDFDGWDGIEDRMWAPPTGDNPDWGGFTPRHWYKFEYDLSAYLPADQIQFRFEDPYPEGGWGPSLWDTRLKADGEEVQYLRTGVDDEEPFFYEDNSQFDGASDPTAGWRFADGSSLWTYQFDVPDDTDDLTVEFTLRNGFKISARSNPPSDGVTKDDVDATRIPAVRIPYTGDAGGVDDENAIATPAMEPRDLYLAPDHVVPHGPTAEVSQASEVDGADDISADVYFGYNENNLYLRADVTDDEHVSQSGENLWQGDSFQFFGGDDAYAEYGISRSDGGSNVVEYFEGGSSGPDAIDVTTSRDDANNLTTYELTIPWDVLYSESKGDAGDNGRFGLLVNESDDATDDADDPRDAWLGWPKPTPAKELGDIGTLLLEHPPGDDG